MSADVIAVIGVEHGVLAAGVGGSQDDVERLLGIKGAGGFASMQRVFAAVGDAGCFRIETRKKKLKIVSF